MEEDKKKKKSDKKDKEGKEGKEKKEKKPKDEEGKEKKEKKHKDKEDGGSKEKKSSKKETAGQKAAPTAPPPRQPRGPPPRGPPKQSDDYMAGLDLPSSSDSEEEVERSARMDADEDQQPKLVQATDREAKKLADKDRKAMEKAHQLKLAALREDDNVFDVSYEGQGEDSATASATDVKCHNLTVRAKGKLLLENCTFTISAGRRYGLVGPNGRGKSTLLRLLAKRQLPVPENLDVLLVEQEVEGGAQSALEAVVAADVELMQLRAEEAELNQKLEHPDQQDEEFDQETAQERLNEVYERQNQISASSAESRASKILHGLGFNTDMQRRPTQSFSGGWRMRISLARALYIQPTLLLLDEPTNHLDLRAVLWLEEYLQRWKKTLVVVSHDRDFLNTVTTDIIHLHDNKLHQYKGNFAQFDEMYEQRRREANKAYEKFEKQMKAAKSGGGKDSKAKQEQVRTNAAKNSSKKNKNQPIDDAGASTANINQPQKWSDYSVEFHFPTPTELPPPLIQAMDVDFKYPGRDDFGLKNVNFGIDMGSRVAIVGPNGAGKTTFMNLLSGDLEPVGGESRRSHKLRIGRYAQHFVDALSYDENPVEYLMNRFPESRMKPEQMRAMLGRFGLSGQHHLTPICKLSGGQKSRVVFTAIALLQPHILLLDEPTNHLDMQSIDALCDALDEFQGGVVVISHDAQLLSRLCADEERSQVLIVEDGTIKNFPGDFEDYRNQLVKEIAEELDEE
uniref:ABC transporter domain-containing protein n=1 Tax=Dunaliella tertiolecta TaxID=3047 RepID=A0A7S3QXV4_DUNTE